MADYSSHFPLAEKACKFLTSSPDPYHAVQNMITRFEGVGYARLSKRDPFAGKLEPGECLSPPPCNSVLCLFFVMR
eukprot:1807940-Ditylum_brightwellii.AAC.1